MKFLSQYNSRARKNNKEKYIIKLAKQTRELIDYNNKHGEEGELARMIDITISNNFESAKQLGEHYDYIFRTTTQEEK